MHLGAVDSEAEQNTPFYSAAVLVYSFLISSPMSVPCRFRVVAAENKCMAWRISFQDADLSEEIPTSGLFLVSFHAGALTASHISSPMILFTYVPGISSVLKSLG